MSRIAKIPVTIAKGVTVAITEADVTVKGPVGEENAHPPAREGYRRERPPAL